MTILILVVIAVGIYEIIQMAKNKQKKEMVVWVCMAILTIAFGVYFYSDANTTSLSALIFNIFNIKY